MDFRNRKHIFILLSVLTVIPLFFYFLYNHNNRYRYNCPQPEKGVLNLAPGELDRFPLIFLAEDWSFYSQALLSPEYIYAVPPTDYISIGRQKGFGAGDNTKDIHGHGTYYLKINTGVSAPRQYMLEIPEILTSYRLWINGDLLVEYGESQGDKNRPEVAHNYIVFSASETVEIIIAARDFTSRTPGITKPPAFGNVSAVSKYLVVNVIFTTIFVFLSMIIGTLFLFSMMWSNNQAAARGIGLLCYSFAMVSAYPLVNIINFPSMALWHILKEFFYYFMVLNVLYLHAIICRFKGRGIKVILYTAMGFCAYGLLLTAFVGRSGVAVQLIFTFIEKSYILGVSLYLLISTGLSLIRGKLYSPLILVAVYIFTIALAADAFIPYYEPLYLNWTNQMGSLAFIAVFSVTMNKETAISYRLREEMMVKNAVLEERTRLTEYQLVLQQVQYRQLADHIEQTRRLRHDLRHHISVISAFLDQGDLESLKDYVEQYRQGFPAETPLFYCDNSVVNAVVGYYLEIAAQKNIETSFAIDLPEELNISGLDLCIVFGNCLENALEACDRLEEGPRFIDVRARMSGNLLSIKFSNSFDGIVKKQGGYFLTRKKERKNFVGANEVEDGGNKGIGITSVEAVAHKYGGVAYFESDDKIFCSTIMMKNENKI